MAGSVGEVGSVPATYQHISKLIEPADDLILPGSRLKWYDVRRAEAQISAALQSEARQFLTSEVAGAV